MMVGSFYDSSEFRFMLKLMLIKFISRFCIMNMFMMLCGVVLRVCRMVMLVCLLVISIISIEIRLIIVIRMISERMMNIIFFFIEMVEKKLLFFCI